MKRFHVHVPVDEIRQSTRFYAIFFGAEPSVTTDDHAKWMLEDPGVNFAVSKRASVTGVDHLAVQVDSGEELTALEDQLRRADGSMLTETNTTCCYAKTDMYRVTDPQGAAWETFHTLGSAPMYCDAAGAEAALAEKAARCCPIETAVSMPGPKTTKTPASCCG